MSNLPALLSPRPLSTRPDSPWQVEPPPEQPHAGDATSADAPLAMLLLPRHLALVHPLTPPVDADGRGLDGGGLDGGGLDGGGLDGGASAATSVAETQRFTTDLAVVGPCASISSSMEPSADDPAGAVPLTSSERPFSARDSPRDGPQLPAAGSALGCGGLDELVVRAVARPFTAAPRVMKAAETAALAPAAIRAPTGAPKNSPLQPRTQREHPPRAAEPIVMLSASPVASPRGVSEREGGAGHAGPSVAAVYVHRDAPTGPRRMFVMSILHAGK